ncbi:MAG: MFS transporter [Rhodobacterales bacterium]|nr:MFS transporter [Rhodobacterales bacterium]
MTHSLRLRLILWYVAAIGSFTIIPFVAVVLANSGMDTGTSTSILMLFPIGQLIGAPAWSWIADRTSKTSVLRVSTGLSAAAGIALACAQSPSAIAIAILIFAITRAPTTAIGDAITLHLLGDRSREYGAIRATGSISFAVWIYLDGYLMAFWPNAPLWIGASLLVCTTLVAWTLPEPGQEEQPPQARDLLEIFTHPVLMPLMVVGFLHGLTLRTYDTLFSLHVQTLSLPASVAGTSLAVGVGAEVLVMWFGPRLLSTIGPFRLIGLAVASAIPRWWFTAHAGSTGLLIALQALHGLSFGGFWIAGVALFSELAPKRIAASSQALFATSSFTSGYLAAMLLAKFILTHGDTTDLFEVLTAISALATTLAFVAALRAQKKRPANE